jgi:hypothetical protein
LESLSDLARNTQELPEAKPSFSVRLRNAVQALTAPFRPSFCHHFIAVAALQTGHEY